MFLTALCGISYIIERYREHRKMEEELKRAIAEEAKMKEIQKQKAAIILAEIKEKEEANKTKSARTTEVVPKETETKVPEPAAAVGATAAEPKETKPTTFGGMRKGFLLTKKELEAKNAAKK